MFVIILKYGESVANIFLSTIIKAMKKNVIGSVLLFAVAFGVAASHVDGRVGFAWAYNRMKDPVPESTYSLGDADINGMGFSVGVAVENYRNGAFWADLSFTFPGQFKLDGKTLSVPANSYLYYANLAAGYAMTFDTKAATFYLGIGYSIKELCYRYNLNTHGMYREYNLMASGPTAYVAAKVELARNVSIQLTALPTLTINTVRITRTKGGIDGRTNRDFIYNAAFAVDASVSLCYTF